MSKSRTAGGIGPADNQTGDNEGLGFSPSEALFVLRDPTGTPAEAIRALRTHLMARHFQEGRRALACCTSSLSSGCSVVAANLAVALSQIGVKTVIIDADLRAPSQAQLFGASDALEGLSQCLVSEEGGFSRYIYSDVLPSLSLMLSGSVPDNPQELLGGSQFKSLIDFCMREFQATIVDTPPANTCADCRRVATVIGYSLIVTRRNVTFVNDVQTLADQLRGDHAQVVGTVLNEA